MEITEGTWKYKTHFFDCGDFGRLAVVGFCPKCHFFLKKGKVFVNMLGGVKLEGWTCKRHGEVKPDYLWDVNLTSDYQG
jgi:hypothetical protein